MPYRMYREGDTIFVRAVVVEAASDCFKIRIQDNEVFPQITITTFAPVSEIAKPEDIDRLKPRKQR